MNERNGGEVKERVISFRLSPEDYELIEEIARLDGENAERLGAEKTAG